MSLGIVRDMAGPAAMRAGPPTWEVARTMAPNTPPPTPSPMAGAMNSLMARMSQGEQFVAIGGLVVLVVAELLLGALLGNGGIGITSVLASTTVLVAIYLRHSARTPLLGAQLYAVVLVVLTALIAVPALDDLLSTLHNGFVGNTGLGVIFELAYWIGAGLMAWGALVHWRATAA
jgi:hypothetical protein